MSSNQTLGTLILSRFETRWGNS